MFFPSALGIGESGGFRPLCLLLLVFASAVQVDFSEGAVRGEITFKPLFYFYFYFLSFSFPSFGFISLDSRYGVCACGCQLDQTCKLPFR